MTINQLFDLCKKEIFDGNGDLEIVLCHNGSEFEFLENNFSSPVYNDSSIYDFLEDNNTEEDSVIVLN